MTEETITTTNFLLGIIPDGPDTVLRRFQRLITLEQQQDTDSTINENARDWMTRVSTLRENWHEEEISLDRRIARLQKQSKEVESHAVELQHLRDCNDSLKEQLEAQMHQCPVDANLTDMDEEIRRLEDRISVYERTFGLEIRRTKNHGNIQVVMRGCNELDYDLPSYVIMRPNADSTKMDLIKCNPPVADIDKLVNHFNEVGDFRSFLLVLRSRFVKYFQLLNKKKQNN